VLRHVDREVQLSYLQLAFFGLLVLMIAWFGGERLIVAPIRSLARTATRLGRGDLTARPERQRWAKEFEPLAAALTDMAQKLAERDRDLRAANNHLEHLASIDALSGLANRRGFDARLAAVWQRSSKLGRPVGLLMIDVDHLREINTAHGHVAGDRALASVAEALKRATREYDVAARFGGDEFCVLLPETDLEGALVVAERMRTLVEETTRTTDVAVTVSIGAVAHRGPGTTAEELIAIADRAAYQAKASGRNAIAAAPAGGAVDEAERLLLDAVDGH